MASLIPGYEYDIFISYRQKDNKHDCWVTKFVENLKGEIEATFKEDISIYFDENPHDRLQETHDVDKSLKGKLKCLIFIPILSQTYCDPNSYAWQYEFLAFNIFTINDRFGRNIRLRNGNFASRILPIRIHDLEQEDIKLFENETGGVLRAMDFVFKTSSGVNRPLKYNEDHPLDNLNKTYYGDQINKVANAIKEIIQGIKSESATVEKERTIPKEPLENFSKEDEIRRKENPIKSRRLKLLSGGLIIIIFIIATIIVLPKLLKHDTLDDLRSSGERISIAVMPFQNMTNDTTWNIWQGGIQELLITALANNEELTIRQTESINTLIQGRGFTNNSSITPFVASKISQKLNANVFVYGNIIQSKAKIRVSTQLIDSKTEDVFKTFQIDGNSENEILLIIDSLSILIKNYLIINVMEKELSREFHKPSYISSPKAYRYFVNGNHSFYKLDYPTATEWLLKAIEIDSNFFEAINLITFSYSNQGLYEESKKWSLRLYEKRNQMTQDDKISTSILYARNYETPYDMIKYYRLMLTKDTETPLPYYNIGNTYNELYLYDKAIPEFEKELKIYKKWDLKPRWINSYTALGLAYHKMGMYKEEKKLYKKAEKDFPDAPTLIYRQAILSLSEGATITANRYIEKFKSISKESSVPHANIQTRLGEIYSEAKVFDKAEEYYRQALSFEPGNPVRINTLAYFLIDKDRNKNEGMELVESALKLQPDNYGYLHTKGWGLFKQGKYQEAFDLLDKSWKKRKEKAIYDHEAFLHLEAAKKAVAGQKNN